MAVSRGSYRTRDLWRLHVLHRVLPCHLILPHTLVGLPANVATSCNTSSTNQLPEISFQVGRSVLLNKDYCFDTYASSLQIYGQLGTLGICSRGFFLNIQSAPLFQANNFTFVPFQCPRSEVKTRPQPAFGLSTARFLKIQICVLYCCILPGNTLVVVST